jgi:hypothetical protein
MLKNLPGTVLYGKLPEFKNISYFCPVNYLKL